MKKLLSFCLVCALTLSVSSHASAIAPTDSSKLPASPSVYLDANEKIAFAASIDQQVSRIKDEIKPLTASRDETVEYLLLEVPLATGDDRAQLISELESYGIYEFEGNVIESAVPMSDSGEVDLTTPQVFYDSLTKEWTVTGGGSWKSREWVSERPVQGNVGGSDAFGVGYTYTNGDYNTLVVSASAALRTEDKQKYKLTDYRSDGDGSKGFGFRLQDEVIWNNGAYDYLGAKWSGSCTYDAKFISYSGIATGYYIHTYNRAVIDNISFGFDGKHAGIDFSISFPSESFDAFSSDKRFG